MGGRTTLVSAAVIVLLCIAVLAGLSLVGRSGRVVLEGTRFVALPEPQLAVAAWSELGVRGRILVLFDREIHAGALDGGVTNENYVYQAAEENLVRQIYHVVPDASWDEVRDRLSRMPGVSSRGGSFRLTIEGTPILVSPLRRVPPIGETALIAVRGAYWNDEDLRRMASLVGSGSIRADIIAASGPDSGRVLHAFGGRP